MDAPCQGVSSDGWFSPRGNSAPHPQRTCHLAEQPWVSMALTVPTWEQTQPFQKAKPTNTLKITFKMLKLQPRPASVHLGSGGKLMKGQLTSIKRLWEIYSHCRGLPEVRVFSQGSWLSGCHGHGRDADRPRRLPWPPGPASEPDSGVRC